MRYFRRLFHKPKHSVGTSSDCSIYRSLAPSVLGVTLCVACLCGTSWAWFTASATAGVGSIKTATLAVATVTDSGDSTVSGASVEGGTKYELVSGKTYTVKLAPGTSQTGYCVIKFGGTTYYTPQLTQSAAPNGMSITVYASDTNKELIIAPQWGICSYGATIADGGSIGSPAATAASEVSNTVSEVAQSASGAEGSPATGGSSSSEEVTSVDGDSSSSGLSGSSGSSTSSTGSEASTAAVDSSTGVDG